MAITASEARKNLFPLIQRVNDDRTPVEITSKHGDAVEKSGTIVCSACHGADFRGAPLAEIKVAKSFSIERRTKSYAPGDKVGCYDCHNGPRGD